MRIIFFLLISLQMYASQNLIDIYQKEGSAGISKIFDDVLATKDYWDNKLADQNTSFGYFESINHLLTCNKETSSLKLYSKEFNNSFILEKNFSAFIGEKQGDKQREGDLKTPIGVYRLLQKLDNVDSFYGPLAFVTSYPNTLDKAKGKNGSGIWVHGLPLNQSRDDFTKGCIAIDNSDLKYIEAEIDFRKALIYIDQDRYPEIKKDTLALLLSDLYTWKQAWKENDFQSYLNFYDSDFKHKNGLNFKRYKRYKQRIFNKNESKQILFTNINIIPYPMTELKEAYLILFYEEYNSKSYTFKGKKELYVYLKDGHFSILSEQ
ncbi:L,D-transpeptidase family protein [Sulfurimonas sp. MAG313]|nr:L,D-transpeptidase family protein [Sulfurimonas sp. MAG313]MDF1881584.1 L,D-transpeptidase family protein [Sulfurimonas sp. MAG313]